MSQALLSTTELLGKLVGFDSVSRNSNVPIADFICNYLDRCGVLVNRLPTADGDKVNLIARVGPGADDSDDRAGLVLSGHMDVVPADEPDWRSDPFELTETDGALYGRGACDMKGFLAQSLNLACRFADEPLRHPLVLVLTCDEEIGTVGAAHLAANAPEPESLPGQAVVGEPTELRVVRLHKGHTKMRVSISGRGAHSGYPQLGVNAIEPAGRILVALSELRESLQSEQGDTGEYFPETPYPVLNVSTIHGGSAINVVPDRCVIQFGVRLLPGMEATGLVDRVRALLRQTEGAGEWDLELINDSPALNTATDAPIYRARCDCVGQTETFGVSYASDAGWLQRMGMECVLFGGGSIEVAHKANEFIPRDQFARADEVLEQMVRRFCME